jgi:DUF4097 and DUF4098 domain-containing protein YvlB
MNERRKILDLLQEGKISAEQAEMLLDALEQEPASESRHRFRLPPFDKPKWDSTARELKTFGTQISTMLSQALGDAKKEIEHQVSDFMSHDAIFRSHDFEIPEGATAVCIETTNCKIRAIEWDQPVGRVSVHGQIRRADRAESERGIPGAVNKEYTNGLYRLSVTQSGMTRGVRVTSIDVFLPEGTTKLQLKSRNGALHVDSMSADELELQTQNGHITTAHVNASLIRAATGNGRISMFHSIGSNAKNVYVASKNGTIAITGIDPELDCIGTVKTLLGQFDIDDSYFEITSTDGNQKIAASFQNKFHPADARTTIIACETENGKIIVHPA